MIKRLKLINCDEKILQLILKGDSCLSEELNLSIPNKWAEYGKPIFTNSLAQIKKNPNSKKWLVYIPVLIESNTLVGSCGFKGAPNSEGIVEIGYEVVEKYRNKGYATEIVKQLIQIAFNHKKVTAVQANTSFENNISKQVLEKCGFEYVGKIMEDGEEFNNWVLNKT